MKNMRTKRLGFILLSLITLCWTACDKDDNEPITLQDVENNSIAFIYPSENKRTINILGGNEPYSVICNDTSILHAELANQRTIDLQPLKIGNTTVSIKDPSGNSYILYVHIGYYEQNFTIIKHDVKVLGENITIKEKKELEEKALASIPVKIKGGYKFVFTEKQKGEVLVYPEIFGEKEQKGTFEFTTQESSNSIRIYDLEFNGKKRKFILTIYQDKSMQTKNEMLVPFTFLEDITEQFKTDYPAVEAVYTEQVFKWRN